MYISTWVVRILVKKSSDIAGIMNNSIGTGMQVDEHGFDIAETDRAIFLSLQDIGHPDESGIRRSLLPRPSSSSSSALKSSIDSSALKSSIDSSASSSSSSSSLPLPRSSGIRRSLLPQPRSNGAVAAGPASKALPIQGNVFDAIDSGNMFEETAAGGMDALQPTPKRQKPTTHSHMAGISWTNRWTRGPLAPAMTRLCDVLSEYRRNLSNATARARNYGETVQVHRFPEHQIDGTSDADLDIVNGQIDWFYGENIRLIKIFRKDDHNSSNAQWLETMTSTYVGGLTHPETLESREVEYRLEKFRGEYVMLGKAVNNVFKNAGHRGINYNTLPEHTITGTAASKEADLAILQRQTQLLRNEINRLRGLHNRKRRAEEVDLAREEVDLTLAEEPSSSVIGENKSTAAAQEGGQRFDCLICFDSYDKTTGVSCDNKHPFCKECALGYVRSCLADGTVSKKSTNQRGDTKEIGNVACPLFSSGNCNVGKCDLTVFLSTNDKKLYEQFDDARVNALAVEKSKDYSKSAAAEQEVLRRAGKTSILRQIIHETFACASGVFCPVCKVVIGHKGEGNCTHMKCETCKTEICYVCGITMRRGMERCSCAMYLHSTSTRPVLTDDVRGSEQRYDAALHEFHRRKIAHFLHLLKAEVAKVDISIWDELLKKEPGIFTDIVSGGRSVTLKEIEKASDYPHVTSLDTLGRAITSQITKDAAGRMVQFFLNKIRPSLDMLN